MIAKNNKTSFWATTFLVLVLFVSGCQSNPKNKEKPKTPTKKEVKLKPTIFFISSTLPRGEGAAQMMLKSLNTAMATAARQAGADSVTQMIDEDSMRAGKKPPTYKSIKFFPVFNGDRLQQTVDLKYAPPKYDDSLRTFNMKHNFAFVVTHPPSYNKIIHSDDLKLPTADKDTLLLELSSVKVHSNSSHSSTGKFWKTSIYKIPHRKNQKEGVVFRGDTLLFQGSKSDKL